MQDLVYRSEYLSTLVSNAASIDAPPDQDVTQRLGISPMPQLITATSNVLNSRVSEMKAHSTTPISERQLPKTKGTAHGRIEPPEPDTPLARSIKAFKEAIPPEPRAVVYVADPSTAVDPLHGRSSWNEVLDNMKTMVHPVVRYQGQPPGCPLEGLKVRPVPGVPESALARDYAHMAETELMRHAGNCKHVEQVTEAGLGDTSMKGLSFAQFFWKRQTQANDAAEQLAATQPVGPGEATLAGPAGSAQTALLGRTTGSLSSTVNRGRFLRVDDGENGAGDSATHRFSLMEGGTMLVRSPGRDPFQSRATVAFDQPALVLSEGHYFEVEVRSVFFRDGPPDRPKPLNPRGRSEGLVLGMTPRLPTDLSQHHRRTLGALLGARDVPMAWCVSSSGTFYFTGNDPARATRPVSPFRVKEPASWHRRPGKEDQPRCCHPPAAGAAYRKNMNWSMSLSEADRVGMLVTTFGAIVIVVNGERDLVIPDAGVVADQELYPIVEVYNHVRSVKLWPGARPPR